MRRSRKQRGNSRRGWRITGYGICSLSIDQSNHAGGQCVDRDPSVLFMSRPFWLLRVGWKRLPC